MINRVDGPEPDGGERFQLLEHLGRGGFANTWKARVLDEDLIEDYRTNIVALKIPTSKKTEKALKRDISIGMQLTNIRSPNLVRFIDFSAYQNTMVMVMEYVPGGSLEKLLCSTGKRTSLAIDRALRIAEGALNGIVAIHAHRILHRDIKPANVLMDGEEPKLADFGISRIIDPDQKASTSTGTIPYMSPEQLYGQASFPADQWSFGVMCYEMLTGKLPWREVEQAPLIDEIRGRQPRPPVDIRSEIPLSVSDFIMKALEKNPADRFVSAADMLEALRQAKGRTASGRTEAALDRARQLVAEDGGNVNAESELQNLLKQYPREPGLYQILGEYHNRRQSYDRAIATFEEGLAAAPDSAVLHWDLGVVLHSTGQKRAAAQHLRQAIDLGLEAKLSRHAQMLLRVLATG